MDRIFDGLALVRWLHFGAVFALFGGAIFLACAPRGDAAATRRVTSIVRRVAAPAALLTGVAWLCATIVNMTGGLEGLGDAETLHAFFLETLFGPIEIVRIAVLLLLAAVAFAPMRESARDAAIGVMSGLLLVSQAWLGHAAEGGQTWHGALMIACYAAHVLAAAAWVGGLPPLLARIAELRRKAGGPAILHLLSRYSLMASFAVALVVASGVANAAFRVPGHLGALWPSNYGTVLSIKVALVILMLALAAYNRFVAMPRLRAPGADARTLPRIGVSIGCEIALALAVLAAAAVLGITPPPSA